MYIKNIFICVLLFLMACQHTQPLDPPINELSIEKLSSTPSNSTQQQQTLGFSDIATHWARDSIEAMRKKDIVAGMGNGRFNPDANVTRAEFAAFLLRTLGIKPELPDKLHFIDTNKNEWYAATVETAYTEGLIGGYDDQTFRPKSQISRLEMALLLVRAIKRDQPSLIAPRSELYQFHDVNKIGDWAKDDLAIAVKTGLMGGLPGNLFGPNAKATRAQSVVTLNRILLYKNGGLKKPNPQEKKNALPLGVNLKEWEFIEENKRIYAISEHDHYLYVLTTNPLALESKIKLAGNPTDLEYWNQKVYVSIPEKTVINVVDLAKKVVVKSYNFDPILTPDQIAIDHTNEYTKLFFTEYTEANLAALGVMDLRTEKVEMISRTMKNYPNNVWDLTTLFARPTLTVDRKKHVLWIGEHRDTSSELYRMNTKDYSKAGIHKLYVPVGDPIPQGDHVFFGGRRYHSGTLKDEGRYLIKDELLYATDRYVYGPTQVFDREKFNIVGYYGNQAKLLAVDKRNVIYLFNSIDQTVYSLTVDLKFEPFSYSKPSQNEMNFNNKKIEKWLLDPSLPYLYAISWDQNKLLYIRTDTMTIENELIVGPEPSDLELHGDHIYISHFGTNDIYKTDRRFSNRIEKITLDTPQLDIEVANDRLFYEGLTSFYKPNYEGYLINSYNTKMYDLNQKKSSGLFPKAHFNFDILGVSADDSNLYILADDELRVYNPKNMELLRSGKIGRNETVQIKDNEVYTDNVRYNLTNFAQIGSIQPYIKGITDKYVFVNNQVYNRNDLSLHKDLRSYMVKGDADFKGQFFVALNDTSLTRYNSVVEYIERMAVKYRPTKVTGAWSYDRTTEKLYGLNHENSVTVLNTKDMTFSYPPLHGDFQGKTDLAADNGRLYIPIENSFEIKVVDANTLSTIETIKAEMPFHVKVFGNKLLYYSYLKDSVSEGNLFLYDMKIKKTTVIKNENGEPYIVKKEADYVFVDETNEVIVGYEFLDEDQFMHTKLVSFSGNELKQDNEFTVLNTPNPKLIVDQGSLFVGTKELDVHDLNRVKQQFKHIIIYVTDKYAISGWSIFNRETGEMLTDITTTNYGHWGVITSSGKVILYTDIGFLPWNIDEL